MKRAILLLSLLVVACSGCATSGGRGSRILPWNWFSSDSTAQVQKAEARISTANDDLDEEAHRMAIATEKAIAAEKARQLAEGGVSRELTTAGDYARRTVQALDARNGFLDFDVETELTSMVALRNSQIIEERNRGDKLLAAADRIAQKAATAKVDAGHRLARAQKAVGDEQQRALVAEEKYHRIWFWIWVAIGIYILVQILPLVAHAFPGFSPIAKLASWIAAPMVQAGYSRLRKSVGEIIHTAESGGAMAVDAIRAKINGPNSEAEQNEIRKQYNAAAAKAATP